jgi:acyl carrier protein
MNVTEAEIVQETRRYIADNFLYARPDRVVGEDEHLMERGIVDSMGMMELIDFLEERFGVQPGDDEITEQNFATLALIAGFVARKRGAGVSGVQPS